MSKRTIEIKKTIDIEEHENLLLDDCSLIGYFYYDDTVVKLIKNNFRSEYIITVVSKKPLTKDEEKLLKWIFISEDNTKYSASFNKYHNKDYIVNKINKEHTRLEYKVPTTTIEYTLEYEGIK